MINCANYAYVIIQSIIAEIFCNALMIDPGAELRFDFWGVIDQVCDMLSIGMKYWEIILII